MNQWTDILGVNDIPKLGARVVRHGSLDIAVFRTADDEVFAMMHSWNIELDSGCAVAPDHGCAREFAVKVEDGRVWLDLTAVERVAA